MSLEKFKLVLGDYCMALEEKGIIDLLTFPIYLNGIDSTTCLHLILSLVDCITNLSPLDDDEWVSKFFYPEFEEDLQDLKKKVNDILSKY